MQAPLGRGINDWFFCFACDGQVWECDHLLDDRLAAGERINAIQPSSLQSFTYDGKQRILEIEFGVTAPFIHGELPLPPPPRVIQYFNVPRYIFTRLIHCNWARA